VLPWTSVVGNKADLEGERKVSLAEGIQLAENYNAQCLEASAKTAQNTTELFEGIADVLQTDKTPVEALIVPTDPVKKKPCGC
jgi:GTPase SAR1 family protein